MTKDERATYEESTPPKKHFDQEQITNKTYFPTNEDIPRVEYNEEKETILKSSLPMEYKYLDHNIKDALMCPICSDPFINPVAVPCCGQTFCSGCIVGKVDKCPNCRKEINVQYLQSNRNIGALVDELEVECSLCKTAVHRGQLKNHQEKYCPLLDAYIKVNELKEELEESYKEKAKELKLENEKWLLEQKEELEKKRIQNVEEIKEERRKFEEWVNDQKNSIAEREKSLDKELELFNLKVLQRERFEKSNKPIHLNLRGVIMTFSLGDFIFSENEPDNLFKTMFTDVEYPLYQTPSKKFDDPIYFIDCDSIIFKHIIDWLKFGIIEIDTGALKQSLINTCSMFGMKNMVKKLQEILKEEKSQQSGSSFIETLQKEIEEKKVRNLELQTTIENLQKELEEKLSRKEFEKIEKSAERTYQHPRPINIKLSDSKLRAAILNPNPNTPQMTKEVDVPATINTQYAKRSNESVPTISKEIFFSCLLMGSRSGVNGDEPPVSARLLSPTPRDSRFHFDPNSFTNKVADTVFNSKNTSSPRRHRRSFISPTTPIVTSSQSSTLVTTHLSADDNELLYSASDVFEDLIDDLGVITTDETFELLQYFKQAGSYFIEDEQKQDFLKAIKKTPASLNFRGCEQFIDSMEYSLIIQNLINNKNIKCLILSGSPQSIGVNVLIDWLKNKNNTPSLQKLVLIGWKEIDVHKVSSERGVSLVLE